MSSVEFRPLSATVYDMLVERHDGNPTSVGDVARTPEGGWGLWPESGGMLFADELVEAAAFIRQLERED